MKNTYIEQLKQEIAEIRTADVRACSTCRHCPNLGASYRAILRCNAMNSYLDWERLGYGGACGKAGLLWEPKPPSFWKRLGDAIISRIRVKNPK